MAMTADLHCHTIYSSDSCNRFQWIVGRCEAVGINCLAVTDHNRIDGALRLQEIAPFPIIVGEEIDTGEGEIIGLFLDKRIAPMQGLEQTLCRIKEQGGIVYLPHPLSISRDHALDVTRMLALRDQVDIVEIFNSRTRKEHHDSRWLTEWISRGEVICSGGSDAHFPCEFGNVKIEMPAFTSRQNFLQCLRVSRITTMKKTPVFMRVVMNHYMRKVIRRISMQRISESM